MKVIGMPCRGRFSQVRVEFVPMRCFIVHESDGVLFVCDCFGTLRSSLH